MTRAGSQGRKAGSRGGLLSDAAGAAAVEYALLASLVALAIVGSLGLTGRNLSSSMNKVNHPEQIRVDSRS